MCGRYASSRRAAELADHFGAQEPDEELLAPSWNVAPTDPVVVVLERDERRVLEVVRWGLVPSWSKDAKGAARMINARVETVRDKPAFRRAFAQRRCLVPADGYYEWQRVGSGKQPWFLSDRAGAPLAMAGLFEHWRAEDGSWLSTCTVLTTSAADDTGEIHERTPLVVPEDAWGRWLDRSLPDPGEDLLVPGVAGTLDAWQVGPEVGNVRNNTPALSEPTPG